jgi:hypothetical protein
MPCPRLLQYKEYASLKIFLSGLLLVWNASVISEKDVGTPPAFWLATFSVSPQNVPPDVEHAY